MREVEIGRRDGRAGQVGLGQSLEFGVPRLCGKETRLLGRGKGHVVSFDQTWDGDAAKQGKAVVALKDRKPVIFQEFYGGFFAFGSDKLFICHISFFHVNLC